MLPEKLDYEIVQFLKLLQPEHVYGFQRLYKSRYEQYPSIQTFCDFQRIFKIKINKNLIKELQQHHSLLMYYFVALNQIQNYVLENKFTLFSENMLILFKSLIGDEQQYFTKEIFVQFVQQLIYSQIKIKLQTATQQQKITLQAVCDIVERNTHILKQQFEQQRFQFQKDANQKSVKIQNLKQKFIYDELKIKFVENDLFMSQTNKFLVNQQSYDISFEDWLYDINWYNNKDDQINDQNRQQSEYIINNEINDENNNEDQNQFHNNTYENDQQQIEQQYNIQQLKYLTDEQMNYALEQFLTETNKFNQFNINLFISSALKKLLYEKQKVYGQVIYNFLLKRIQNDQNNNQDEIKQIIQLVQLLISESQGDSQIYSLIFQFIDLIKQYNIYEANQLLKECIIKISNLQNVDQTLQVLINEKCEQSWQDLVDVNVLKNLCIKCKIY